jgi:6-phosphofructokinase 1
MRRIAVLTSGGDAPGMNAAIRTAVLIGRSLDAEVWGIRDGYSGLLQADLAPLPVDEVAGIQSHGGTVLGTSRSRSFMEPEGRKKALDVLEARSIEGLVVIGGNGSLTGLHHLLTESEGKLRGIGIPASIDNDLGHTRLSIGVDTAVNTIVDACDKIGDTASSHGRVFIIEVMGRHCGYLAMAAGVSAAAHAVLFPESGKSDDDQVETVLNVVRQAAQRSRRRRRPLVLKAEGVAIPTAELAERVQAKIEEEKIPMEVRTVSLGHVVRGGRPSALDRQVASRLAHSAVVGLMEGHTQRMASWSLSRDQGAKIAVPSPADPRVSLVELPAMLEETQKMRDGTSAFVAWRQRVLADLEAVFSS